MSTNCVQRPDRLPRSLLTVQIQIPERHTHVLPQHENILVGHEHLERVDAALFGGDLGHLMSHGLVPVGDGHVQAVVATYLVEIIHLVPF